MNEASRYLLCRLDELADPGSKGCRADLGGTVEEILVVRRNNRVFGYINRCPHTGGPLVSMTACVSPAPVPVTG
jgi:nitrite reductase/ring-hydroxylating ferredoxin subunit